MRLSEEMREPFQAGEMIVVIWLGLGGASQGRTYSAIRIPESTFPMKTGAGS